MSHLDLSGAASLTWLGFRRAFGESGSLWTVTRFHGHNSPAPVIFQSSTKKAITFLYPERDGEPSDLTHFSHNTYYRTLDGSLIVCFPGLAGKPPGWLRYTPRSPHPKESP